MAHWQSETATDLGTDIRDGRPLPAEIYGNEDVFDEEQEAIFKDSWQYIGSANAISDPGEYYTAEVAGIGIFVIRDNEEQLRAFFNVCPHRGSKMLNGCGQANRVMCPYHNWTFDKEGSFCSAPSAFSNATRNPDLDDDDVEGLDPEQNSLREVAVETLGPFVFANLSENPMPFENLVGTIPEEIFVEGTDSLELADTHRTELDCNWKVMTSNYLECDHCHSNHPDFVRTVDMNEYEVELRNYHSVQHGPIKNDQGEQVGESRFYFLWPNTTINIYEEGAGYSIYRIEPSETGETDLTADYFFDESMPEDERQEFVETSLTLQEEDFELVERQHTGLTSGGITQGRFGPNEHAVHHFHRLVADHLSLSI
jgi:nitrite reductase/ring-hydroxylating ferredoxin subunit